MKEKDRFVIREYMKGQLIVKDKLYGDIVLEGVYQDLVISTPFQRLKGVHQGGAIYLVDPSLDHTRYDHSLGVYWLVTQFGGSSEERVAALLHDISHTAFSHVADAILDYKDEDYHEQIFSEVIERSEIPSILSNYGFKNVLSDFERYSLLEQPSPRISADRIDYTLRDLYQYGLVSFDDVRSFLAHLAVKDGRFVITSSSSAAWFDLQFKRLNMEYFKRPEHLFATFKLADILKKAIEEKKVRIDDLMLADDSLIEKLQLQGFGKDITALKDLSGFEKFEFETAAKRIKSRIIDTGK